MTEPVGLAIGVVGLAGLFNNVIDCFNYVHIGKTFGGNFQTSLLKLDNAKLRLSRWGEAMGFSGGINDASYLPSTMKAKDKDRAAKTLGQILNLFKEAGKISAQFKSGKQPDDQSLLEYDEQTDLDLTGKSLHQQMAKLSIKRQNGTTLSQKVKFALYEESRLTKLINDITFLTNDLVSLFPAIEKEQQKLCTSEVAEFTESLKILSEAAKGHDQLLEKALSEILKSSNKVFTINNHRNKVMAEGEIIGSTFTMKFGKDDDDD